MQPLLDEAAQIRASIVDLKAVNPTVVAEVDTRTPQQIIHHIEEQGRLVAEALVRLNALMATAN